MERNPTNDPIGTGGSAGTGMGGTGASTLGTGTDSLGVTGQGADQNATNGGAGVGASSEAGAWNSSQVGAEGAGSQGLADRLNQVKSVASDRLGQVREKAGELKSTLADKLEAGATSLRNQGSGPQLGALGADGTATATTQNDPMTRLAGPAADAMERTAQFLREGDLKATVENQIRTNPARTLLIAVGVGYLLGKALRSDR